MKRILRNKCGPWVSDKDFFDRTREIGSLTKLLNEGNNVLIVAPRRVGKTSLVREIYRRLDDNDLEYQLFVDVQHCTTPVDVITALSLETVRYESLHNKVVGVFKAFLKQFQNNVESIGLAALEIKIRAGLTGDWQAKGKEIMEKLAQADRPVNICFDELPVMLTRLLGAKNASSYEDLRKDAHVFLSWLRHVMEKHPGKLRFIVCGSIGIEPILKRHGLSHTITHLRPFPLGPWDQETAKACLHALAAGNNIIFTEAALHRILDHLGVYIPHHVQMFFAHLHEDCLKRNAETVTPDDVDLVYRHSMLSTRGHAELRDYEERLLRVLEGEAVTLALDLLTEAAVSEGLTSEKARLLAQRNQLDSPDAVLREVLEVLEHDGYLAWDEVESKWFFSSFLLKNWWKNRFEKNYLPLQNPKKGHRKP